MTTTPKFPVTDALVDDLLKMRAARLSECVEPLCPDSESVALLISGQADAATRDRAKDHLQACPDCLETYVELQSLEGKQGDAGVSRQHKHAAYPTRILRFPRQTWPALAVAASLVFGLGLGVLWPREEPDPMKPWLDGVRKAVAETCREARPAVPMGDTEDALHVFRAQAGGREELAVGDTVNTGDHLRFKYSAKASGYLAVLALSATEDPALLFPQDANTSAPIEAGSPVLLPVGVVATPAQGCEWLVAVFSDKPLDTAGLPVWLQHAKAIAAEILSSGSAAEACPLQVAVPGARSISVFPVRR